jgi:uncharacterized protein YbaP (TraB family)
MKRPVKILSAIISISASVSISIWAYSQTVQRSAAHTASDEVAMQKNESIGLIFKITKKNTNNQLLLIGSAHAGFEQLDDTKGILEKNLNAFCKKFADETTFDESMSDAEFEKEVPIAKTAEVLSDELVKNIHAIFFRRYGASLSLFNADSVSQIKKLPISTVAALLLSIDTIGTQAPKGISIDQIFKNVAQANGEKIEPLERRGPSIAHYRSISNSDYLSLIEGLTTLLSDQNSQKTMGKFGMKGIVHQALGDADAVRREFFNSFASGTTIKSDVIQNFFFNRDIHMADQIEKFSQAGDGYCIAVGAAHLGGETGILKKLANKNFTITQVKN